MKYGPPKISVDKYYYSNICVPDMTVIAKITLRQLPENVTNTLILKHFEVNCASCMY